MKKLFSIIAALLVLTGCQTQADTNTEELDIITTYYPFELIAEEVGGNDVNVESIYPADSEAHSYELTPNQTINLQEADLVIISNPDEDSKIYDILKDSDNLLVLDNEEEHNDDEHEHSHTWLSPKHALEFTETITDKLIELDEEAEDTFLSNSETLTNNLTELDKDYTQFGESQTKPIVATHDAYSALDEDYGIEFITLYGQHHDDEPTTKEVIATVDTIKEDDINTIFVEQDDTSNKIMRQIADEASVDVETIFTLETQSSIKDFDSVTDFYEYNLQMMELGQE